MKNLLLLLVSFCVFSCSMVKVSYKYEEETDFSKYKTYQMSKMETKIPASQADLNLVVTAIEKELAAKGFTKSDSADIKVDVHIVGEKYETEMIAAATYNYDIYTEGTLLVTFIDNANDKMVWQGAGKRTINEGANPSKREANINDAVKQIFKNYPPSK